MKTTKTILFMLAMAAGMSAGVSGMEDNYNNRNSDMIESWGSSLASNGINPTGNYYLYDRQTNTCSFFAKNIYDAHQIIGDKLFSYFSHSHYACLGKLSNKYDNGERVSTGRYPYEKTSTIVLGTPSLEQALNAFWIHE